MADGDVARGRMLAGESVFTAELGAAICGRVAAGESLMQVARDPAMPHRTTFRNWTRSDPTFAASLADAMRASRLARRQRDREITTTNVARPKPVKGGSASTYTRALGGEICDRIANGESVVRIGADPAMPCAGTIYAWVKRHPHFQDMYVTARQLQADYLFDEAREVGLAATPNTVWVGRLQFDIIRWQAARLAPHKYCERIVVAHALAPPPPVQKKMIIETVSFIVAPNGKVLAAPPRNATDEAAWVEAYGEPYNGTVPRRDRS